MKLGIKKIEYRPERSAEDAEWSLLNIVQFSATLSEEWSDEAAGLLSTVTVEAEIRRSSERNDRTLNYLLRYPNHYRLTDMNGTRYTIGNHDCLPRLTCTRSIAKLNPNGYRLTITYKSDDGLKAQS
jgi:hypothetical protein